MGQHSRHEDLSTGQTIQGSNPNRGIIFLFFKTSTATLGPIGQSEPLPWGKAEGRGVNQSPPYNAQFKKEWSYTPTPTPHT